jgi:hypothetical protein
MEHMKKVFLVSSFLFIVLFGNSQTKLLIVDGITKEPLPYTTIQSIHKKEGFITDENGFIQLDLSQTDTIHISYVGYKSINYLVGNITNGKVELFKETGSTLPDVLVKRYTPIEKPVRLGFHKLKMSWRFRGGMNRNKKYLGPEIVTLVEFPNEIEKYKILKVILPTNKVEKNDPLRLHIYSINDNGEPFEELLLNDVVIDKGSNLLNNLEVDISNQNIVLNSKGVFVGIQWVGYFDGEVKNTTDVSFTQEINKENTYSTNVRLVKKTWVNKGIVKLENTSPSNLKVGLELQKMK